MRLFVTVPLLAAAAVGAIASPVAAQQWTMDVHGGRIRSSLDPAAEAAQSVVAGVGYQDPAASFRVSTGIPTASSAPYWGSLSAFKRLAAHKSGFTSGMDLSGDGFLFRDRAATATVGGGLLGPVPRTSPAVTGHALSASALPLVGFEHGPLQLQARAGVSYYSAAVGGQQASRTLGMQEFQVTLQPNAGLAIAPVVRRFEAAREPAATFAGVSGVLAQGPASVWASLGRWTHAADTAAAAANAWVLGSSYSLGGRATLDASVRHDGFQPISLAPPQTSWSVGVTFVLGAHRQAPPAPVPAAYRGGKATIKVPVRSMPSDAAPSVAGDFNNWVPARMERDGADWKYTVSVAPGVYDYAFVSPSGDWFVPDGVPGRKDDGMGGQVAVLVVR